MASGPRCQHHQSHDTRALVVVVVIMSCSRGSHVASCHSGCVVWWLWLHGLVVVVVVASCHGGCGMAVVAVTSRWWWWSCHVAVATWHGGGGQSHGLVVVVAVAS